MHLPPHPASFWLILASPYLIWLALWIVANFFKVSLKPLIPWLAGAYIPLGLLSLLLFAADSNKTLRFAATVSWYGCWIIMLWIKRRYMFETLRTPGAKWYSALKSAEFSVSSPNMRIRVRDIDCVSPWYVEKLGLRRLSESPSGETDAVAFAFKEDGNAIVLTTHKAFGTEQTPMLFTKKIGRIRNVLAARGVAAGAVEQDRQGIRHFEIRDPEGNAIEVVEQP